MMKYQVLIKTISGKGGEFWEAFQKDAYRANERSNN